jgi:hypothetical protein
VFFRNVGLSPEYTALQPIGNPHRMRMFANRMRRKFFRPMREEVHELAENCIISAQGGWVVPDL